MFMYRYIFCWKSSICKMSCLTTRPTKWYVCPAKTQISLGMCPAWSESSLSAWRKLGSLVIHWVLSKDWSDWAVAQADLSLRWVHSHFVGLSCCSSNIIRPVSLICFMCYCSVTGYGQTGPDAQRAGYDVIVAGTAGLTHITGPKVSLEQIRWVFDDNLGIIFHIALIILCCSKGNAILMIIYNICFYRELEKIIL